MRPTAVAKVLAPVTALMVAGLGAGPTPAAASTRSATATTVVASPQVAVVHLSASGVPPLTAVSAGAMITFQNDDRIARSVVSTTPNWSITGNPIKPGGSFALREPLTQPGDYRYTSPDGLAVASSASGIITVGDPAAAAGTAGTSETPGTPGTSGTSGSGRDAGPGGPAVRGGRLPEASTGREFGLPAVLAVVLIVGVLSLLGRTLFTGAAGRRRTAEASSTALGK